jgi:hypothetical protein
MDKSSKLVARVQLLPLPQFTVTIFFQQYEGKCSCLQTTASLHRVMSAEDGGILPKGAYAIPGGHRYAEGQSRWRKLTAITMTDVGVAEATVEDASLSWFEELGYSVRHGGTIAPGEMLSTRNAEPRP